MKTKVLVVAVAGLIAAVIAWVYAPPERPPAPVTTEEVPVVQHEAPHAAPQGVADADQEPHPKEGELPVLDSDRLFDKSYEIDPDLVAIAEAAGLPPACIIALAKLHNHGIPLQGECPPITERGKQSPSLEVGEGLYEEYTNAELESLATSDPRAAVVLARRTESDAEARKWYERAVVLSGIGEPLLEWMYVRTDNGLSWTNGQLDVAAAAEGYKTHLIVAAIDGDTDPDLESFERELENAGVDPGDVEREAAEEVARLRQQRKALTGEGL